MRRVFKSSLSYSLSSFPKNTKPFPSFSAASSLDCSGKAPSDNRCSSFLPRYDAACAIWYHF
ncbi:hypothetical protein KY284_032470 [Solanum tuberosum]|nr:hypothetical protein KY284_032470 [Solanum tuberosum]